MLANFPAAIACISLVIFVSSISVVSVNNNTQEFIQAIELNIGSVKQKPVFDILPRGTKKKRIRFNGEGALEYSFELNGQIKEGIILGYTSSNRGHYIVITIAENSEVTIQERHRPNIFRF